MKPWTKDAKDEVRAAKKAIVERFDRDADVTDVSIGSVENGDALAVVVTVVSEEARGRMPGNVDGVPVRVMLSDENRLFQS